MASLCHANPSICLLTFCEMVDLPRFAGGNPKMGPVTLKFELGRDFCKVHLPTKFHYPALNRSQVNVLTNKYIHKQTKRFCQKYLFHSAMLRHWRIIQF